MTVSGKKTFQVALPRGTLTVPFSIRAESEYDAAQQVAKILKPATYARRHPTQEHVWEVYRHQRGEDWSENRRFQVVERPAPTRAALLKAHPELFADLRWLIELAVQHGDLTETHAHHLLDMSFEVWNALPPLERPEVQP